MIITKLDKVGTKQVRLFFDEEKYCLLYYNEIRRLGFHEQDEIGQEEFEELNKLLLHPARASCYSYCLFVCGKIEHTLSDRREGKKP